jgi:hypothetical protein
MITQAAGRSKDYADRLRLPGRPRGCPLGLPQIRTCPTQAYGSSSHGFAPRSAIRRRFVDRLPRLGVLDLLPDDGSVTRPPLPSAGSSRGECPDLTGTMEGSDSCHPVSPDSCAARQYPLASGSSLPPRPDADAAGQEFRVRHSSSRRNERGRMAGLSGCWGTPVDVRHVLGPRQDPDARQLRHPGMVPPFVQTVDSLREA